ncbi:MAG: glutamate-5-semialdehyde dehydrogenase [Rhodobiaceae bacterium]|nr:MAG: glutamate-5-semialdehyde dehydrogenase [Rhodobiaceae bacterium]
MSIADLNAANDDVKTLMAGIGRRARLAAKALALVPTKQKDAALLASAMLVRANAGDILEANLLDMEVGRKKSLSDALLDRLMLDDARIEAIAKGIEEVASLKDPVGDVMANWDQPSGLNISRVRVPLGVIGVIYESRPNVTADAAVLCLKAGNAAILRGGSESFHSSRAIFASLEEGMDAANLPEGTVQIVPTTDRDAVGEMLKGLDGNLDLIIPRGGRSLIERVQNDARVPVFAHLEGLCHVYVDGDADLDMAREIVVNAKMRRTAICGSAETVLVDKAAVTTHMAPIVAALLDAGCEVRGDDATQKADARVKPATNTDFETEYLDAIISIAVVDGVKDAMRHISEYGSDHTDCIVTENVETATRFLNEVDSAIVLHNASTQYADGGEFGMGAEIGIATGKFHARGPVGLEQLTSFKYQVRGSGQVRP